MVDILISAGQVVTEQGILKDTAIGILDQRIATIEPTAQVKTSQAKKLYEFPKGYHILPGFIDLHVHGADGFDVMDSTLGALSAMSKALAKEGTTSFLATTMTAPVLNIDDALANVQRFLQNESQPQGASILGIHLEGPFLSEMKMGAQPKTHLLAPNLQQMQHWINQSGNQIRLVTLAPELPGALALIQFLKEQKIVVSMGHSDASYEVGQDAINAGCSYVTHLFNAMRGIHHREPGIALAALLSGDVFAEMIVDGAHLHPAVIELILRVKTPEKALLVTDAMRAKCMPDGDYELSGQMVVVKDKIARLGNGTLAGSTLTMFAAVQNLINLGLITLEDAVKLASENPAKIMGLFDKKGSITPNKHADLVVLDPNLNVVITVNQGQVVYQAE